jgi:hypothetical protein
VVALAKRLELPTVPPLYIGQFTSMSQIQSWMVARALQRSAVAITDAIRPEGFVLRVISSYSPADFGKSIAKFVRKGHIQTDDAWRRTWAKTVLNPSAPAPPPPEMGPTNSSTISSSNGDKKENGKKSKTAGSPVAGRSPVMAPSPSPSSPPPGFESKAPAKVSPPTIVGPSSSTVAAKKLSAKEEKAAKKEAEEAEKLRKSRAKSAPKFVLLVGLPGSGKSTFGRRLEAGGSGWIWVSKDELGSRSDAEQLVVKTLKGKGNSGGNRCIMDMCNVTIADRKTWIATSMINIKEAGVVYFATSVDDCVERAAKRKGHPTGDLFVKGGGRAMASHAQKLQVPTTAEGFGSVTTVNGWDEMNSLLSRWGGAPFTADEMNNLSNGLQPDGSGDVATTSSSTTTHADNKDDDADTGASISTASIPASQPKSTELKRDSSVSAVTSTSSSSSSSSRPKSPASSRPAAKSAASTPATSTASSSSDDIKDFDASLCAQTRTMNIQRVYELLKLDADRVMAVYVYGSRVWGTATASSDWDFVIVIRAGKGATTTTSTEVKAVGKSAKAEGTKRRDQPAKQWTAAPTVSAMTHASGVSDHCCIIDSRRGRY